MFLTSIAICGGAGGALLTGVNAYRQNKRKRETPWTVYAEKISKNNKNPLLRMKRTKGLSKLSGGKVTHNTHNQVQHNGIRRLFPSFGNQSDIRRQQLKEMTNTDDNFISEAEKKAYIQLAISVTALTVSTGGLFYAPLNLIGVPITVIALNHYVVRAYEGITKEKKVGVAVLDVCGISAPLVVGQFFVAAFAVTLSNLSRILLIKTEDHSQSSLTNVFGLKPQFVWIQQGETEIQIPFDTLKIGDIVVVDAGQMIPIDGIITSGVATIDQRTLTGESQPVEKTVDDQVLASTVVLEGRIGIQVTTTGQDTVAAQIGDILNNTSDFKSSVKSRGQKIVDQGALPTIAISLLTLPILGAQSALAMLCASFGYHMRHAAPISVLNYLRIASERGVLIKDGRSLELLSEVDTFVFDKTGTLTEEVPTVGQLYPCNGYGENELLTLTAAAEYKQTHPIAQAIRQEAKRRGLTPPPIDEAKYEVGYGLKVKIDNRLIRVGSGRFMEMEGIAIGPNYQTIQKSAYEEGYSLIYVAIDNQLGGAIELVPTIRPEVKEIVSALKSRKMSMYIISGDHEKPTRKLAEELGIEHYFAETLPQNKAQLIEQLQQEGKSICFVGDGINDSIALKTANVSISLRGASTAATDSASIILMDSSLNELIPLLDLSTSLDANLNRSLVMTVLPGVMCVGGVLFLHLSIMGAIILYYSSLAASLSNAMWPLIRHSSTSPTTKATTSPSSTP
ncbi:MAG: heavy metal translocating P-type ATPase [Ardenticatenaceae bacterium]